MNREEIQDQAAADLQEYVLKHQEEVLNHIVAFNELMNRYEAAIKEVSTKLEILKSDLKLHCKRDCITAIQTRIKSPVSIFYKLNRRGLQVNLNNIRRELNDVAGIRVICSYIDDIYTVAEKLGSQDDIQVVLVKDYIQNPKPNGYRSYHMIVEVPVFFSDAKELLRVEIQIRTVAMDFWASLEHDMKYKKQIQDSEAIGRELKECADTISETDRRMMDLRDRIQRD